MHRRSLWGPAERRIREHDLGRGVQTLRSSRIHVVRQELRWIWVQLQPNLGVVKSSLPPTTATVATPATSTSSTAASIATARTAASKLLQSVRP